MTKTLTQKATSLILASITAIGGILVAEQVLSGEQLASIQGIAGMVLTGGGFSAMTIIYILTTLLPKNMASNLVDKVGADKVNKVFETVDEVRGEVAELKGIIVNLLSQIKKEAEARTILGAYDDLTPEDRNRLDL